MDKGIIKVHEFIMIMESLKLMRQFTEHAIDNAMEKGNDEELIAKGNAFLIDHARLFHKLVDVMSDGAEVISNLEGFLIAPVCKVDIEEVEHDGIEQ